MSKKAVYMNEDTNEDTNEDMDEDGSDGGFEYPDSDYEGGIGCEASEYSECREGQEGQEEYPEFYNNLELVKSREQSKKGKSRSMSIDSSESDANKNPNFKCGSCKKTFLLDKKQKMIRCTYCGYRILFKLRTRSHITYKTE